MLFGDVCGCYLRVDDNRQMGCKIVYLDSYREQYDLFYIGKNECGCSINSLCVFTGLNMTLISCFLSRW